MISRLTEWNLVVDIFKFPKARGKQSTDSTEGRAVPALHMGPEHDRGQRGPTQQPVRQQVHDGMLAENYSKCTRLIQHAGVLLSSQRRFPGGCCSHSPATRAVPRSPLATLAPVQAACCSARAPGKGCPQCHGVTHAPA